MAFGCRRTAEARRVGDYRGVVPARAAGGGHCGRTCQYDPRPVDVGTGDGRRRRYGERVSTGFVESAINTVVGKRFGKRQQMRWSRGGAHLMLQTRTRALDGTLREKFEQWYPGLKAGDRSVNEEQLAA